MDKYIKGAALFLFTPVSAMKRLLIAPLALMLIGYAASSCSSSTSKEKEQNDSIAVAKLEAARQDSIAAAEREAARLNAIAEAKREAARQDSIEEAKRKQQQEEEEKKRRGPEWLQGSWELTINSPYGVIATYHLTINGQNAHLVEGNKDRYNGLFEIIDDHMIVGPRKYYINESYQRLDYAQYRWHKISGGSSSQASSGRSSSFDSSSDVMRYLSGRTFYNSGDGLRIDYDAVYFNGTAMTGAPRVVDFSGNSATIVANSPYSGGGSLRFYVNSSNGTVTQNGDVYRER